VRSGAGCRATYFNHAKKLAPVLNVPKILLSHSSPPAAGRSVDDHLNNLKRRFGNLGHG
jgi:hypothetical protein